AVLPPGEPVQARSSANRPRFSVMGLPQFSDGSGSDSAEAAAALGVSSLAISFVFLRSGYAEHAMKRPNWPHLMTIGLPNLSQISSVGSSWLLRFSMFFEARFRSFSNFL